MDVKDQVQLIRQATYFKPLLTKAMIRVSEVLLDKFQLDADRTKGIHTKLYNYALFLSRRGTVSNNEMVSCITTLLDDVNYSDPSVEANQKALTDALFNKIKDDYMMSFTVTGTDKYLSWIERLADFALGDEKTI